MSLWLTVFIERKRDESRTFAGLLSIKTAKQFCDKESNSIVCKYMSEHCRKSKWWNLSWTKKIIHLRSYTKRQVSLSTFLWKHDFKFSRSTLSNVKIDSFSCPSLLAKRLSLVGKKKLKWRRHLWSWHVRNYDNPFTFSLTFPREK